MAVLPKKNVPVKKNVYGGVQTPSSVGPGVAKVGSLGAGAGLAPAVTAPAASKYPTYQVPGTPATEGSWFKPDYKSLLAGDWQPAEAQIQGDLARQNAQGDFQRQLRSAFIDFGGDPSKLSSEYSKYIDAPTIEAAKNNQYSQTAQNLAAMTKNLAQSRAQAAARGMTFSGQSTENTRIAEEARQLGDVNAGRTFTAGAEQGLKGLGDVETQIAEMIRVARENAAARIAQENPYTWTEGTPAVPGWTGGGAPAATSAPAWATAPTLAQAQSAYQAAAVPVPPRPAPKPVAKPLPKPGTAAWYQAYATPRR